MSLDTSAIQYGSDELIRPRFDDDTAIEVTGEQIAPPTEPIRGDTLSYEAVLAAYERTLDWLVRTYVDTLNVIYFVHDRYAYERLQMALHDNPVRRFLATGIAGLSVAVDGLSAIKHATVRVILDETGLAVDYTTVDGEFPCYGNNDDRADDVAVWLVERSWTGCADSSPTAPPSRRCPC